MAVSRGSCMSSVQNGCLGCTTISISATFTSCFLEREVYKRGTRIMCIDSGLQCLWMHSCVNTTSPVAGGTFHKKLPAFMVLSYQSSLVISIKAP